jgi:succinoglycan biosynthesis protein ExoO
MKSVTSIRVSVIVPAFNARAFISRAIDSALGQSLSELEVLVVDDASSDATADFVESKYHDNSRVRLLRLKANGGPARARNIGIDAARGEWIAILDADDAWQENRLARLLPHASEVDAVFDNLVGYDAETGLMTGSLFPVFPEGPVTLASLLASRIAGSQLDFGYLKPIVRRAFLVNRSVRYDETLRTSEDLLLYLTLVLGGARTRMVDEALYLYTMPTSASKRRSPLSRTRPRDDDVRRALERMLEQYRHRINEESATLFTQRIEHLRQIAPVSEFYHARHMRNYGRMALLIARHVSVQREVVSRAVARLSR